MKKILFVLLDGAADIPRDGYKTSYQSAHKPNLDKLAKNGVSGLIDNNLGDHPDSGHSLFSLFGYTMSEYPGRGYLDALGDRKSVV
jgi:2,3-bisphosphoglycerate-independent phosphoglycerate mutase